MWGRRIAVEDDAAARCHFRLRGPSTATMTAGEGGGLPESVAHPFGLAEAAAAAGQRTVHLERGLSHWPSRFGPSEHFRQAAAGAAFRSAELRRHPRRRSQLPPHPPAFPTPEENERRQQHQPCTRRNLRGGPTKPPPPPPPNLPSIRPDQENLAARRRRRAQIARRGHVYSQNASVGITTSARSRSARIAPLSVGESTLGALLLLRVVYAAATHPAMSLDDGFCIAALRFLVHTFSRSQQSRGRNDKADAQVNVVRVMESTDYECVLPPREVTYQHCR
ncbi:hypothetical protein MTO96_022297 [Rhipicephalus appendiculatus]